MLHFPIYLDNCATTACDARAVDALLPYFTQYFGNPSSRNHAQGWEAAVAVEEAQQRVAGLINAAAGEVYFTSGATESCNLALRGICSMYAGKGDHIITTRVEHKAVLDTCKALEKQGTGVTYLDVDAEGQIDLDELSASLRANTILIAVQWANNETGALMPIEAIGTIAHENNILFFCDATQAVGKIPVDVKKAKLSLMAFSSHKLYGPKGVGALYISRKDPRVKITPQITGGGQQKNIRSGTLNVPGIVGFGKACALSGEEMDADWHRLSALRNKLEQALLSLPETFVNGHPTQRLPHVTNLSFGYLNSNEMLSVLNKDIAVSSGSACTSGSLDPSYVLKAMRQPDDRAKAAIRFSLGRFTTEEEIDYTIAFVCRAIAELRKNSPAWQLRH
ncbi:MAG: cysteine desulfurase [Niabella sp.]|nr:cysteine desulfurase [Niabella sp.]